MLTGFEIHNFRGLRELSLTRAARVNLVVGRNDSGKTSFLEAIRLLLTGDPRHMRRVVRNRLDYKPLALENDYRLAFHQGRMNEGVEIRGNISGYTLNAQIKIAKVVGEESLPLEFDSDIDAFESNESLLQPGDEIVINITVDNGASAIIRHPLRGRDSSVVRSQKRWSSMAFPDIPTPIWLGTNRFEIWAHARRYSDLYRKGGAPLLLDLLKEIEPRLNSLLILADQPEKGLNSPVLEVDIGLEKSLPLTSMGDGFSSTIAIMSAIGSARDGLCLIDEIENGLHYSLLPQIWRSVASSANVYNAQVWATTHSYDCIAAACAAFEDTPELLHVHRLERRDDGSTIVHTFDYEMLGRALERGLEVR